MFFFFFYIHTAESKKGREWLPVGLFFSLKLEEEVWYFRLFHNWETNFPDRKGNGDEEKRILLYKRRKWYSKVKRITRNGISTILYLKERKQQQNLNRKQDSRKKKRKLHFFFESFSFVCQMACVYPIKLSIYYKTRISELRWLVRERVSSAALRKYWKYVLYKWVFFHYVMRNQFNDDNNQNWNFWKKKKIYILKSGSWTLSIIICNRMNLFLFIMYIRDSNKVRGHNWIVPRTIPSRTKFYMPTMDKAPNGTKWRGPHT